ncbi:MAG TPA: M56 family metallopeptidase [Gemmataceae bacterium]|jgi:WD40 repeat protein/beta-lactamase regulating signal transducer with metallopeptidase domain|nr:M56 family metallopeptidase [Gemmataceae bacterium]
MDWLLHVGLSNAVLAALLAGVVWVVTRKLRRPAVAHSLWLLVLLKLVTPPFMSLPVLPNVDLPMPVFPAKRVPATPTPKPEPQIIPRTVVVTAPPVDTPRPPMKLPKNDNAAEFINELLSPDMAKLMPPREALAADDSIVEEDAAPEVVATSVPALETPEPEPEAPQFHYEWLLWLPSAMAAVWVTGSLLWWCCAAVRLARFRRWLRYAEPAPASLLSEAETLARQLGLPKCPDIRLVPGQIAPLIWALGRKPVLYFPAELLNRLDSKQRSTLLLHEMAHLRRGDHWVRWLELLALGLFWWLPAAWLARRELHRAEEECCDAWVLRVLPAAARTYASALLDTLDFLAGAPALPAMASGICSADIVKRRLLMILKGPARSDLPVAARLALIALALTVLPLLADQKSESRNSLPGNNSAVERLTISPAAIPSEEPFLYDNRSTTLAIGMPRWWMAAVSPDGKNLAVACGNHEQTGAIQIWDVAQRAFRRTITHISGIRFVAFSPDNKTLAAGSFDNTLRLYDVASGQLRALGKDHTGGINSLAYSKDGKLLVTGSLDRTIKFWTVPTLPDISPTPVPPAPAGTDAVAPPTVAAAEPVKPVEFKSYATLEHHVNWVLSVALSQEGKTLVSGSRDLTACIWDVPEPSKDGKPITITKPRQILRGHNNTVESVAITADGATIATGSWEGNAKLWDAKSGQMLKEFSGFPGGVNGMTFSPDGKTLAIAIGSGGNKNPGQLKAFDVSTGEERINGGAHEQPCRGLVFVPDGKTLITVGEERALAFWDVGKKSVTATVKPPNQPNVGQIILSIAVSPDGKYVAVAGESKGVMLYDLVKKESRAVWTGHDDVVSALAFSPDSKTLASASYDRTIKLWDLGNWNGGAAPPVKVLKGHTNWVFTVAFSPDGRYLASGSYDKSARLWDLANWKTGPAPPVKILMAHTAGVRTVAFSPDSQILASSGADRTVRFWKTDSGEPKGHIRGHKGAIRAIAFSPDGKTLATGSEDKTVKLWTLILNKDGQWEGTERAQLGDPNENNNFNNNGSDMVATLAFSPKGRTLASGTWNGQIHLWDPELGKQRSILPAHQEGVSTIAFTTDGQQIISGSFDKTVKVWPATAAPNNAALSYEGHKDAVWALALSNDGKWTATGSRDGTIRLYERRTVRAEHPIADAHPGGVMGLAFSADSKTLASSGKDGVVRLWKLNGEKIAELKGHTAQVTHVAFSQDGKWLASAGEDKEVRVWDMAKARAGQSDALVNKLTGHTKAVMGLAFSPDSKLLASGSLDKSYRIYDTAKWEVKHQSIPGPTNGEIYALAFTPDGKTLALAHNQDQIIGPDGDLEQQQYRQIMLVDPETGKPKNNMNFTHPDWIYGLTFTPDSKTLITICRDMNVRLWSMANGQTKKQFRAHDAGISQLAMAGDDGMMATAGEDWSARLWTVLTNSVLARTTIVGHQGQIWFAEFSKDGTMLASGGDDTGIRVRFGIPGSQPFSFGEGYRAAFGIAVSPDQKLIATGHDDGLIKIWDAKTGQHVKDLPGHKLRVWSMAWTPDSRELASVSGDWDNKETAGEVKLWDVEAGKLIRDFPGHTALVYTLAITPNGRLLLTAGHDKTVRIWNLESGQEVHTLTSSSGIRSLTLSPDGQTLVTGSLDDNFITFWDMATAKEKSRHELPAKGRVSRVKYSPDGNTIAVGINIKPEDLVMPNPNQQPPKARMNEIGQVIFWDVAKATGKIVPQFHSGMVLDCDFSPNSKELVSSGGVYGQEGEVYIYNVANASRIAIFHGHKVWCEGCAWTKDWRIITGGGIKGQPGELKVWNARGVMSATYWQGHKTTTCAAFNPEGTLLATGGAENDIIVWDVAKYRQKGGEPEKKVLKGHTGQLRNVRFSPDGSILASSGEDGKVIIWNPQTGEKVRTIDAHTLPAYGLAFSPDGKFIVSTAGNYKVKDAPGEVKMWKVATGEFVCDFGKHRTHVWNAAFSPDGKFLALAGGGAVINIYEVETRKELKAIPQSAGVRAVAWSPDGKWLASGASIPQDPIVHLWDTKTWTEYASLEGHTSFMFNIRFSPDSKFVVSAGADSRIFMWDIPQPKTPKAAQTAQK